MLARPPIFNSSITNERKCHINRNVGQTLSSNKDEIKHLLYNDIIKPSQTNVSLRLSYSYVIPCLIIHTTGSFCVQKTSWKMKQHISHFNQCSQMLQKFMKCNLRHSVLRSLLLYRYVFSVRLTFRPISLFKCYRF